MFEVEDTKSVELFKEYLRIKSVHPDPDYASCVELITKQAESMGLPVTVVEVAAGPVVLATWQGESPQLPSLLLTSHMDVVPVFPEFWTHPPFDAHEDKHGNIYARGAQDMKCVGVQYLEAVRRLISQGFKPRRNVHICFTPGEEIGSVGMQRFIETDVFKRLNVGCALDEGYASPDESFVFHFGERTAYNVVITCAGTTGHGSLLHDDTAGEKLNTVVKKFMERRSQEKAKLENNPDLTIGDVTSINLTVLKGGVQSNVVPPELQAVFDCRVSLDESHDEFEQWVEDVCRQAGENVTVEFQDKKKRVEPTKVDDSNHWWTALREIFNDMGLIIKPTVCPAATDSRYLRSVGIPAFNFSPINHIVPNIHQHNECLNRKVFIRGIMVYSKIIGKLASLKKS